MIRKLLLGTVAGFALTSAALAQINSVPQVGVISGILKKSTYSAVALALPPAASATDIACIAGSSTKTVIVRRVTVTGTAGTLVTAPFTMVRRTSVDSGGTAATTTANWANTISQRDSNDAAASATLISYSANPTINDTSPTYIASAHLTIPVTSAGTVTNPIVWEFDTPFSFVKGVVLRGATQQACINLNGVSVSSGLLHISIDWTEE
jgi:hypothetical protein